MTKTRIKTLPSDSSSIPLSLSSNNNNTTEEIIDLDALDKKILLFIMKGHGSSYSVWSAMKREADKGGKLLLLDGIKKVMTYRNTHKRVIKLAKLGLIYEIRPDTYTVHGKKEHIVTPDGLIALMSGADILRKEDVKTIFDYVNETYVTLDIKHIKKTAPDGSPKMGLSVPDFKNRRSIALIGTMLFKRFNIVHDLLSEYLECMKRPDLIPLTPAQIDDLGTELMELSDIPIPKSKSKSKSKPQEIEDIDMVQTQKTSKPRQRTNR